jgi:hypothetical protein
LIGYRQSSNAAAAVIALERSGLAGMQPLTRGDINSASAHDPSLAGDGDLAPPITALAIG